MIWMRFLPHILAAGALLGVVGYVAYLRADNASLREERASLTQQLRAAQAQAEHNALAREVAEAHRAREREREAARIAAMEALLTGDFADADAPIDPRIADILDCLRRESGDPDACAGNPAAAADPGADQ